MTLTHCIDDTVPSHARPSSDAASVHRRHELVANRHIVWCTNPYHVVLQCSLMPGCRVRLAEISADLRENGSTLAVVLHDYALYKSTFTLLYFTFCLFCLVS